MVSKGSFTRSAFTDSTKHMDLGLFCQQLDSLFTRERQLLGTELLTKHALEQVYKEGVPLVVNILLEKLKTVKIKSHVTRLAKCLYSEE